MGVTRLHKVSGEVYYINNSSQLYIKDFTFDGQGFGVYFYIALEGATRPFSRKNSVVVNWPNPSSLERTPVKRAFNSQDIVINSKKEKENSCAPGAKRAPPAALAPATLPAFLAGLGITNEQLAIVLANPQLLQQLQQQGLFPQLQR